MGRASSAPRALAELGVEHVRGDVTNPEHTISATQGCQAVFHLAGLVSYRKKDLQRQYAVNVVGTRNVMSACLANNVERVIHTSSVAAMGIPKVDGELGTEEIEYNLGGLGLNYCDSKYEAELEVRQAWKSGLNVVMLNPGIVFGEGDTHPHHHAIFAAMSKGWAIGVPPGGVTFSDINDVVDGHARAITGGQAGQRYALVSANLTFREAANICAKVMGTRAPLFEIPRPVLLAAGALVETVFPVMFGAPPPLTKQVAWLSQHKIFFSSAKAEAELGFKATPFEETVRRTAPYYMGTVQATDSKERTARV